MFFIKSEDLGLQNYYELQINSGLFMQNWWSTSMKHFDRKDREKTEYWTSIRTAIIIQNN